jgi:hypothetical protein
MCQNALIKFSHTYSFDLLSKTQDEKLFFFSHEQSTYSRFQASNFGLKIQKLAQFLSINYP